MGNTATAPYRTVPLASLRKLFMRGTLIVSAGVSVAACNPQPEQGHPIDPDSTATQTHKRVDAERAHMRESFPDLQIIDFEFMDSTGVNDTAYEQRESGNGLNPYYRVKDRDGMYEAVLAGYDQMGEFNPETRQKAGLEKYMPSDYDYPEGVETTNQRVAHTITNAINADIRAGSLGAARLVLIDRPGEETPGRVCAVVVMSEKFDSDMFVQRFSRVDSLMSREVHDVADFNQAIANHEFAHCVFSNNNDPTWKNESRADLYAIARHIQLNGDDGFAQTWRDLRNMNVIGARDSGHDSVPLLDKAIPVLLEAHERGELEGLGAEELYNFAMRRTAQAEQTITPGERRQPLTTEQYEARLWSGLESQVTVRAIAFEHMEGNVSSIGPIMSLDREAAAENDLGAVHTRAVQNVLDSYNESMERQFIMRCLVNTPANDLQGRYRENLDRYITTQETPQQAYENIGHRIWQLDNELTQNTNSHGEASATFIEKTHRDETGLTNAEKRGILNELREELARQPGVTPTEEPDRVAELNV